MLSFLIVDDHHATVNAMTLLLRADGHTVTPFTSAAEAIAALARTRVDVVVTDLDMPEVDGTEVVRAARAQLPAACVVVVTARAEEARPSLVAEGACQVAPKPLDYEAFVREVIACQDDGGCSWAKG